MRKIEFKLITPVTSSGISILHEKGIEDSDGIFEISKGYSQIGFAVVLVNDDATSGNFTEVNMMLNANDAKDIDLGILKSKVSVFVKGSIKKSLPIVIRTKYVDLEKWDDEEVVK